MATLFSLSLALALLESFTQASVLNLPRATPINPELDPQGWTPRPTASPEIPLELRRRAYLTNAAQYVLIAPDRTCGYVSGSSGKMICSVHLLRVDTNWSEGADFACPSSVESCVFFPVTGSGSASWGAVGCCSTISDCGIRTQCIDSKAFSSSSACNDACRFDPTTLKW